LSRADIITLDLELMSISETDASVASLLAIRNRYLAHRNAHMVGTGTFSALPQLSEEDIKALIERASQIVEKYRQLYGRPAVSSILPGIGDYRTLLELLRAGLASTRPAAFTSE
jgi:hypothetical protein